jgi:DnaK suppressor protein
MRLALKDTPQAHVHLLTPVFNPSREPAMTDARTKDPNQIKSQLLARRADLAHRRVRIEQDLGRSHEPLVADFADQAIQRQNDETLQAIGEAAEDELAAIDSALQRLEAGLYGVCTRCRQMIEPARLEAILHATMCSSCAGRP